MTPRFQLVRRGQSLVEFALVALVVYMLLAAVLTFGHLLFVAQGTQQAADLLARELSRTPLPATMSLNDALDNPEVRSTLFDEAYLVIDLKEFYLNSGAPVGEQPNVFRHLVPQLPLLNQQLITLMIVDNIDTDNNGTIDEQLLRYPGALVSLVSDDDDDTNDMAFVHPDAANGGTYESWVDVNRTVVIPIAANGSATGELLPIVEEISLANSNADQSPFSLASESRGVVALRINYPYQSASMSEFEPRAPIGSPGDTDMGNPIIADIPNTPDEELQDTINRPYYGNDGLGVQQAFGQNVRPYRKVISSQAIYRRELFTN